MSKIGNSNPKIIAHIFSARSIENQKLQNKLKAEKDIVSMKMKLINKSRNKGILCIGEHENKNVVFDTDSDTIIPQSQGSQGVTKLICYSSSQSVITAKPYKQLKDNKLSSYLVKSQRNKEIHHLDEQKKQSKPDFTIIIPGQEKGLHKSTLTKSERRFDKIPSIISSPIYNNSLYNAFSNNSKSSKGNITISNAKEKYHNKSTINLDSNIIYETSTNYNEAKSNSKHRATISPFSIISGLDMIGSLQKNNCNGTKSTSTIFGKAGNDKISMSNYSKDYRNKVREDHGGKVNLLKSIDFYQYIRANNIAEVKYIQMVWRSHYKFNYKMNQIILIQSFWRRYWLRSNLYYVIKRYYRGWAFVKHMKKHCRKFKASFWWKFLKKLKVNPKLTESSARYYSQSKEIRELNATIAQMKCATMQSYTSITDKTTSEKYKSNNMSTLTQKVFQENTPMKNQSKNNAEKKIIELNDFNEKEFIPFKIESHDISIIMNNKEKEREMIMPKEDIPFQIESHDINILMKVKKKKPLKIESNNINILMKTKKNNNTSITVFKKQFDILKIQSSQKMNIISKQKNLNTVPQREIINKPLEIISQHLDIIIKQKEIIIPSQIVIKPFEINSQHMNILMKQKKIILPIQQVIKPFKIASHHMNILTKQKKITPLKIQSNTMNIIAKQKNTSLKRYQEIIKAFAIQSQEINILMKQKKESIPYEIECQKMNILIKKPQVKQLFKIQSQYMSILIKQKKALPLKIESQKINIITIKPKEALIPKKKTISFKIETQNINIITKKIKESSSFKIESQNIDILMKQKEIKPFKIQSNMVKILSEKKKEKVIVKEIMPFRIQSQYLKILSKQKKPTPFKIQSQQISMLIKQKKSPLIQQRTIQPLEIISQYLDILIKPKKITIPLQSYKIASHHMNILTKQRKSTLLKIQSNDIMNILTKPKKIKPLEIISNNISILIKVKEKKPFKIQSNCFDIPIKKKELLKIKPLKIITQNIINIITKDKIVDPFTIQSHNLNISRQKPIKKKLVISHQTDTYIDNSINIKANLFEELYLQLQKEVEEMKVMLEKKKLFTSINTINNFQIEQSYQKTQAFSSFETSNTTNILCQNSFDFNIIQSKRNKMPIINVKKNIICSSLYENDNNKCTLKSRLQKQSDSIEEIIYEIIPLSITNQVHELHIENTTKTPNEPIIHNQKNTFTTLVIPLTAESFSLSHNKKNVFKDTLEIELLKNKTNFDIISFPSQNKRLFDMKTLIVEQVETTDKPKESNQSKKFYKSKNKKKNLKTINTSIKQEKNKNKEIIDLSLLKSQAKVKSNIVSIEETPLLKNVFKIDAQLNQQFNSNIKRFNTQYIQSEYENKFMVKGEEKIMIKLPEFSIEQIDLKCLEAVINNEKNIIKQKKTKSKPKLKSNKTITKQTEIQTTIREFDYKAFTSETSINFEYLQQQKLKTKGKKLLQKELIEVEIESPLQNPTLRSKANNQKCQKDNNKHQELYNIDSFNMFINSISSQKDYSLNKCKIVESFSIPNQNHSFIQTDSFNEIPKDLMLKLPLRSNLFFNFLLSQKPKENNHKNSHSLSRSHLSNCFMKYISSSYEVLKENPIPFEINSIDLTTSKPPSSFTSLIVIPNYSFELIPKNNNQLNTNDKQFLITLPFNNNSLQIPILTESIFTRFRRTRKASNYHYLHKSLSTNSFNITLNPLYQYEDLANKIISNNQSMKQSLIKLHIQEPIEFLSKTSHENEENRMTTQNTIMKSLFPIKLRTILLLNIKKFSYETLINGMSDIMINKQKQSVITIRNMYEIKVLRNAFKIWRIGIISSRIYDEIAINKLNSIKSLKLNSINMITLNGIKNDTITEYERGNQITICSTQNDDYLTTEHQTQELFNIQQNSNKKNYDFVMESNDTIEAIGIPVTKFSYQKLLYSSNNNKDNSFTYSPEDTQKKITKFSQTEEEPYRSFTIKKSLQVQYEGNINQNEDILKATDKIALEYQNSFTLNYNELNQQKQWNKTNKLHSINENSITLTSNLRQWRLNRLIESNDNAITLTSDLAMQKMSKLKPFNENKISLTYKTQKAELSFSKKSFYFEENSEKNNLLIIILMQSLVIT